MTKGTTQHLALPLGIAALLLPQACARGPAVPVALVAARDAAATMEQLITEGHEPGHRDPRTLTPLILATRSGDVDTMSALLDEGADPDARDRGAGWTPLLHAIHKRKLDAVRVLLASGANPNARTRVFTPLIMAAAEPDPSFVRLLLAYGAEPGARGFGGATALSQAVSGGALSDIDRPLLGGCRTETVRALKTHDPALDMPDTIAGRNARRWARFHGCEEVLALIDGDGRR
jgi:ankyrin repeat protein